MVTVYSMQKCVYCVELKTLLTNENIEFIDKDIHLEENKDEYLKIVEHTKSEYLPIVFVDKNILVPNKSYKKITEAVSIIKLLLDK